MKTPRGSPGPAPPAIVVNRRTARARPGDVYIGRPSRWGNPFVVGRDGTRDQVIERYRRRLWTDLLRRRIARSDLAALIGKRLVCWCAPAPCHGDVLAAAAAWAAGGGELSAAAWRPDTPDAMTQSGRAVE